MGAARETLSVDNFNRRLSNDAPWRYGKLCVELLRSAFLKRILKRFSIREYAAAAVAAVSAVGGDGNKRQMRSASIVPLPIAFPLAPQRDYVRTAFRAFVWAVCHGNRFLSA